MPPKQQADDLHWPDAPIQDIPAEEREVLLKQAGPTGEMARVAWQRYQESESQERGDEPQAVMRETTRLEEMGVIPPQEVEADEDEEEPENDEPDEVTTIPVEPEASTSTTAGNGERADAEKKARTLGLEIRDYGTAGEWRVFDPQTGRQVAKSRLDEPPTSGMK